MGKTHCQGHQDPSKRVPIFLGGTEANLKMVPINSVPIPRSHTLFFVGLAVLLTFSCLGVIFFSYKIKKITKNEY